MSAPLILAIIATLHVPFVILAAAQRNVALVAILAMFEAMWFMYAHLATLAALKRTRP